ncbi:MAG: hypothetical protein J6J21_06530 [Clostridia bacterium]|nr:hypothetical protein [Clostridia bacterium]
MEKTAVPDQTPAANSGRAFWGVSSFLFRRKEKKQKKSRSEKKEQTTLHTNGTQNAGAVCVGKFSSFLLKTDFPYVKINLKTPFSNLF